MIKVYSCSFRLVESQLLDDLSKQKQNLFLLLAIKLSKQLFSA